MSTVHGHAHAELAAAVEPVERTRLGRRAQLLAVASVAYNGLEAVIALVAGVVAGSVALVGFGLDSVIEVSSGLVILWQFRHHTPASRERQALRLIALSFFAVAAYVMVESTLALATAAKPEAAPVGIALAVASLLIMPFLSWAQRRTGRALHSTSVVADSRQTLLCTYMSAVLLSGLLLNAAAGWWWADPVAGLAIAVIAVKEGRSAWLGKGCCTSKPVELPRTTSEHATPPAAAAEPGAQRPRPASLQLSSRARHRSLRTPRRWRSTPRGGRQVLDRRPAPPR
jgi:hypothetical protein